MSNQIKAKFPRPPPYPQLIICVLPEKKNSGIYGPWKWKCLADIGIATQCVSPTKINDQYLTNVLLKINSKVVGSHTWPYISRYRAAVRAQSSKVEMIESLFNPSPDRVNDYGIMWELLREFHATTNGRKPSQIIVFRDGVSESQFSQVLNNELDQIIKTYQHLGEKNIPKFTVIVAQKNHHTKLFQARSVDKNVLPGTVVDTKIVHPRNYDFYMCAQTGIIGTSRPAHYHVLVDEIGLSPDDLQNFVHSLSYVYQRSTAAISIATLASGQVPEV